MRGVIVMSVLFSGCFVAPNETPLGSHPAGGGGAVSMGTGGGTAGGGTLVVPDGDATCDQSTCLGPTGTFGELSVPHLAQDADFLYAVAARPGEYQGSLLRFDKSTGARRLLYRHESDPLDANVGLRVRGNHLYFGKTYAGEIWGILSRIPLSGGPVEEVFEAFGGSGNPQGLAYDVSGDTVVYRRGLSLMKAPIPVTAGNATSLHTSTSALDEVVIAGNAVFFTDDLGLQRVPLAGGDVDLLAPGTFRRLISEGSTVYALRSDGVVLKGDELSSFAPVVTLPSDTVDFVRARGTFFGTRVAAGQGVLVDAQGTVKLEAPHAGEGAPALAVDDAHLYLGTSQRLAFASSAASTATCGCTAPTPAFPAEPQACARALCPSMTLSYTRGMTAGALDGDTLYGVFNRTDFSGTDLLRYNLKGGATVAFSPDTRFGSWVSVDATSLYTVDSVGDVRRLDKAGNLDAHQLTTGVRRSEATTSDATHIYFLSNDGLRRVAKAGGASELLLANVDAAELKLDATHVFFASEGVLRRVSKAGGDAELLVTDFDSDPGFALSPTHAYFFTARGLERVKKQGGFKTLVLGSDKLADLAVVAMDVQAADLVLVTAGRAPEPPALWRLALTGGAREKVLEMASNQYLLGHIIDPRGYVLSSWQGTSWRGRGCACP